MIETLVDGLAGCGDAELDERVRALELQRRRIEAELAVTIGEVGRRRSYLDDGHRSVKAYLRATCNWSDAEAARVARLTEATANVPGLVEALYGGESVHRRPMSWPSPTPTPGFASGWSSSHRCCSTTPNGSTSSSSAHA